MPYTEEDEWETFDDDDEAVLEAENGWEDESFGEARRPGILGRKYRPNRRRVATAPSRQVTGLRGGAIRTPAGSAQFRFEKPVATKESVDALAKELRAAVTRVDQAVEKNTSMLDKKISAIDTNAMKGAQQGQMTMLLPLLLTKPPQIESIKAVGATAAVPIETTTYKKDDNFFLIFALMAMSGGLGSGTSDSSSMLILALALSGGLGGSKP